MKRVTKPGGRVVLRENHVSTTLLPYDVGLGEPGLESRMNALFVKWFVEDRVKRERYPHGWDHALRAIGCTKVAVKSFLHT